MADETAETIVVGTDGSDTATGALKEAMRLARALGAELHIVSAYEPIRGETIVGAPAAAAAEFAPRPDAHVETVLGEALVLARSSGGGEVKTHAVRSSPADALLEVADSVHAGLIVVGNRGMHGAKRLVLGSVPNTVSHRATCNVLIVATDLR